MTVSNASAPSKRTAVSQAYYNTFVAPFQPDAYFNYVTMLLHGDGTNGAQNNTFLDSSTNNFNITRNGNTTQGSFSPYGDNWSNYFDGTGDYLNTANSSAFAFGTGDFTVECFINTGSNNVGLAEVDGGSTGYWMWHINAGTMSWQNTRGGSNLFLITGAGAVCDGAWHHLAIVRSSSVTKAYWDGVEKASASDTTNYSGTAGNLNIAYETAAGKILNGYMSNFRIVKGTAVYTAAFTPPTTPLTAITNTSLVTCQSNRFIDNSASPKTITVNGNTSVQRFSPFSPSTAYSTSVIGGSAYFDGSGDSLVTPTSANLNIGTGAFQIDFWMYSLAVPSQYVGPFGTDDEGIFFGYRSGNLDFVNNVDTVGVISAPYPKINEWHHIVLVRNSSNVRSYYIDGVRVGSLSNSASFNQTQMTIGNTSWYGYISNFRVIIGSNIADPTLTTVAVPTSPTAVVSNTRLLTNFTNFGILDNAMMNDIETVGNAQISTSVNKYGTGSLYFDGTGDYLTAPNSELYTFGTGDFTVEFWVYMTVSANNAMIGKGGINWGGADVQGWSINYSDGSIVSSGMQAVVRGGSSQASINFGALSTNTWTHIAVTRSSGTLRGFVGGVLGSSQSNSNDPTNSRALTIGANFNNAYPFTGYIDDLRITKGYARYTTTFTPPTAILQDL